MAVPSVLQVAVPALLTFGQRDGAAIADGQWWRLLTSMFLQDGGWLGTTVNLMTLAISALLVRVVLPGPAMAVTFVVGGVIGNVLTALLLHRPGAGNSMATMFLVCLAAVVAWAGGERPRPGLVMLVIVAAAGVALLAVGDQHGLTVVPGLLAGIGLGCVRGRRAQPTSSSST